jgi:hypothetical protein
MDYEPFESKQRVISSAFLSEGGLFLLEFYLNLTNEDYVMSPKQNGPTNYRKSFFVA